MASDLEQKIIRQIEYYFGDINLPRDKFMQGKLKDDDGWITIEVLLSFQRLANLTKDPKVITEALKKSEKQMVIINEDGTKLKRSPDLPLPELNDERRKELMTRTAYAKGFPLEESLDKIVTILEQYGPIDSITRRTFVDKLSNKRKFKGSCFIIFNTIDLCKKFIETEDIKYEENELIRKWQKDYIDEKRKEIEERKKNKADKQEKAAAKAEEWKPNIPKGAILHFSGIKEDQTLTREEIKEKIKEVSDMDSYLDFNKGNVQGYIRLPEENAANEFYKKLEDGCLKVEDIELKLRVLEGKEEEEYLNNTYEIMAQKRDRKRGNKRQRDQRKRKGKFNDDGPKSKKVETDD